MMAEAVACFGEAHRLVGTVCRPAAMDAVKDVGFVMLNAGVIPRIGPRRFNVKLARHLAHAGFASLRFDLSGQGDSRAATTGESHEAQVRADLRAAMDHLAASTGVRRFVIAGICSGANAGFDLARDDDRIAGLWMLDGHAYPTFKSRLMRYRLQLRRNLWPTLAAWAGRLKRLLGATGTPRPQGMAAQDGADMGHVPTRTEYAQALQSFVDRGVQVYLMYSSDVLWHYSYAGQFRDTFGSRPFAAKVRCEHLPDVDHTLTALAAQQDVMGRITRWAEAHWRERPEAQA